MNHGFPLVHPRVLSPSVHAEILQLIREAKCLHRLGIEIPETAKMVMLQESKFKAYYDELTYVLQQYSRVVSQVLPVTANLLVPHIKDLEAKLMPGMVTLTWTSMNIDAYKHHVHNGLRQFETLTGKVRFGRATFGESGHWRSRDG